MSSTDRFALAWAYSEETTSEVRRVFDQLPIQVDPETDRYVWNATLVLAQKHQLTLYDAAYLELALRRNLPLATLRKMNDSQVLT